MRSILIAVLLISGAVFTLSVLLMSPKAGLGAAIWWASTGGDYGSKKTAESSLKNIAVVTSLIFVGCCIALPYVD